MQVDRNTVFELERKFWQSMVDEDTDVALGMLSEPAFMVSSHGSMKFDHAGYRQMAEHGSMTIRSYELRNMDATFPADNVAVLTYDVKQVLRPRGQSGDIEQRMTDTSTWVRENGEWRCVMHTEAPAAGAAS